MKTLFLAALLSGLPLLIAATEPPPDAGVTAGPSIESPVSTLMRSLSARDLEGLADALASTVEPQIVFYWGETVSGREVILQWHREWFAEPGWSIEAGAFDHRLVGERLATLSGPVRYIKSPERKFRILISYTLVREPLGWKIARIQQTLLEGPE